MCASTGSPTCLAGGPSGRAWPRGPWRSLGEGRGVRTRALAAARRRQHAVHAIVAQDPLDERLRPRVYTERREWGERGLRWRVPDELSLAQRAHHEHADPKVGRCGEDRALDDAIGDIVRNLDLSDAPGTHHP